MPRPVLLMISSMRGGGSERQTLLLLKHLDRKRFTPHLYLTERAGGLLGEIPDDVPVHSFEDAPKRGGFYVPGRMLAQQTRYVRHLIERERFSAVYDRTFHMTLLAGNACQGLGTPRVSTIVSPPDRALPLVERRFVWLKRRRLKRAYQRSRSVVAVSRLAAQSAVDYYGLRRNSVSVIHNPVDRQALWRAAELAPVTRGQETTLVCVGRMTEEKGHGDLLEALTISESTWPAGRPPLKLWMVGDGPLAAQLRARARSVRLHTVEFLGERQNPLPWIAAADGLVLPSRFEGLPNVVLEAMALETPVIATRAGGTVELEREEPTALWAEPGAPATLSQALIAFVNDAQGAKARVQAARNLVDRHHGVEAATRAVEALAGILLIGSRLLLLRRPVVLEVSVKVLVVEVVDVSETSCVVRQKQCPTLLLTSIGSTAMRGQCREQHEISRLDHGHDRLHPSEQFFGNQSCGWIEDVARFLWSAEVLVVQARVHLQGPVLCTRAIDRDKGRE